MSDDNAATASGKTLQQRLISIGLGAVLMLGVIYVISISFTVMQPRSGIDGPSVGASAD